MAPTRGAVTVQFGAYTNAVGAHYWNARDDDDARDESGDVRRLGRDEDDDDDEDEDGDDGGRRGDGDVERETRDVSSADDEEEWVRFGARTRSEGEGERGAGASDRGRER